MTCLRQFDHSTSPLTRRFAAFSLCLLFLLGTGCQKSDSGNSIEPSKEQDNTTKQVETPPNSQTSTATDNPTPTATSAGWPMFRGSPESTGVAPCSLPDKLEVLWEFTVDKGAFEGTAAIVENNGQKVVYIGDLDGTLFSFDLKTGDKRWEFLSESEIGFAASASYYDGHVYIGDIDGLFYCINDKGEKVWSHQTDGEISSSANFFKGNVIVGSQDANLYCFDSKTGDIVWQIEADDQIRSTPTIIDGRAFVAGCDGFFHVVDLDKAEEVGKVDIQSPTGGTPAASGDSVYFGTEQAGFFAVRWEGPDLKWHFRDENDSAIRSNPAVFEEHVIFGAGDRVLRSLDPATKKENWKRSFRSKIESSPVIAGRRVYVTLGDGRVSCLELKTGEILDDWEFDGGFESSPAIAFGRMIIASDEGTVYCLGSKSK